MKAQLNKAIFVKKGKKKLTQNGRNRTFSHYSRPQIDLEISGQTEGYDKSFLYT